MADKPEMVPAAEVDARVAKAVAESEARLAAMIANLTTPPQSSDRGFIEALAMQIASIGAQNSAAPIIAPEELSKREAARDEMIRLLDAEWHAFKAAEREQRAAPPAPRYALKGMVYRDNRRISPMWQDPVTRRMEPTEIISYDIPNEAMVPLNESAKAIHEQFRRWIASSRGAADMPSVDFSGRGTMIVSGPDIQNMKVTASGNVIASDSGAYIPTGSDAFADRGAVRIVSGDPNTRTKALHILGTIHEPARENA